MWTDGCLRDPSSASDGRCGGYGDPSGGALHPLVGGVPPLQAAQLSLSLCRPGDYEALKVPRPLTSSHGGPAGGGCYPTSSGGQFEG